MDNLAKSGDVQAAKTIFSEMSGKGVKIGKFFKIEEKQTTLFWFTPHVSSTTCDVITFC